MKNIQTILIAVILFLLAGVFYSCNTQEGKVNGDKLQVTVTILPLKNIVERIGGSIVNVSVLIPPGSNPEAFEPTFEQMKVLAASNMLVKVGTNLYFEKVLTEKMNLSDNVKIVDCSNGIKIVENNPHIWLGLDELKIIAQNIYSKLSEIRPAEKELFEKNKNRLISKIDSVSGLIKNKLKNSVRRKFVVYHPAWGYFAKKFNLEEIAIESEGKSPGAQSLIELAKTAKKDKLKVIFVEPQFDKTTALALAAELNAEIIEINPLPENLLKNFVDFGSKLEKYFK